MSVGPVPRQGSVLRRTRLGQRLQEAVSLGRVGFQVVALGPLVPGIEEADALLRWPARDGGDAFLHTPAEELRRVVDDDDAVAAAARRIVPADEDAGVEGDRCWPPIHPCLSLASVIELKSGAVHAELAVAVELA